MFVTDIIKFSLRLIISIYFCAVFAFIIVNIGSSKENFLADAFSPIKLYEEIISGNFLFILIIVIGTIFIFRFNYLRRKKVDYEDGGKAWPLVKLIFPGVHEPWFLTTSKSSIFL